MERWTSVQREIADFRKFLSADAPEFKVVAAYDYAWEGGPDYKASRKDKRYQNCGVYLTYSAAGELIYIGVATYAFDKRIWSHAHLEEYGAKYIDLIPFNERWRPIAVALEWFLIARLKPKGNKVAVGYEVRLDASLLADD